MIDKLSQRSNKFSLVLNDNELQLFKNSDNIVQKLYDSEDLDVIYVACIKHDSDLDEQNHIKTLHYHVVMEMDKVCRIETMLNYLSELFHCNVNQISIEKCTSLAMQTRYLLHLDEFRKTRYYESDIVTNNQDLVNKYINMVKIRDIDDLIARVKEYHYDLEECMSHISSYDKWRKYINDLIINYNRKGRL